MIDEDSKRIEVEDRLPVDHKGFLFRRVTNSLVINSGDFLRAIEVMKEDGITSLEINSNFYNGDDVYFLEGFNFIQSLIIIGARIASISPIQGLRNLRHLHIEHKLGGELDFQGFENMEECSFNWGIKGSDSIFKTTTLKKLRIDNYNGADISAFSKVKSLESLSLCHAKISALDGIEALQRIETIDLTGCANLKSLKSIGRLRKLNEIRLDNCKGLTDLDELLALPGLKLLSFNDVGAIKSIKQFGSLLSLKEIFFTGTTNIEDGNLTGLHYLYKKGSLKNAIFRHRKNYTHAPQELGFKLPDSVASIFRKK